jgi:anti-anti-sigma regulatory factor
MNIIARRGDFAIARPDVPLTIQHSAAIKENLTNLAEMEGLREVALDLSRIEKADPTGIGELMYGTTIFRANGRKLYIYRPSRTVNSLLEELEVSRMFPQIPDAEALIGHLHA